MLHGEKKRERFLDECYKDSNLVKGDTQPNMETHLCRGVGGGGGVDLIMREREREQRKVREIRESSQPQRWVRQRAERGTEGG